MRSFLILGLIFLGIVACEHKPDYFHEYKETGGKWEKTDTLVFELNTKDTITSYNLFFHLRATQKYPFNNIFLIAELAFPNGKNIVDTLEYEMTYPDGQLMGNGGNIKESKLWYKQNVRFVETGNYTIKLRQATRSAQNIDGKEALKGIEEVGLSLEKNDTNE